MATKSSKKIIETLIHDAEAERRVLWSIFERVREALKARYPSIDGCVSS